MLTVNIRSKDGSSERIIPVIEAVAKNDSVGDMTTPVGRASYEYIELLHPDGRKERITNADVYVMNDSGSTVAKYQLWTGGRASGETSQHHQV